MIWYSFKQKGKIIHLLLEQPFKITFSKWVNVADLIQGLIMSTF